MKRTVVGLLALVAFTSVGSGQEQDLAEAIRKLDGSVFPPKSDEAKALREMVG